MGDPFSIATGVAGLISLGITVCDGLHTYFSAIKDRKDDLAIVTQNLALFKFHIFAIQSSVSKLGHRHSPAVDGLELSLINCEMQLKSLQALLDELTPTQDPSLAKEIWKKQKLIARYPFDRKKLVQLEEYLSRANTTLSSFIQALNLDINIRISDDLEALKTSLEAIDISTQTTLRTITTRLDVIGPKGEPSTLQLVPSRVNDVAAFSSNNIVLNQTAVGVAETKTSFNGSAQSFEDVYNAHSTPRYLQNAELERRLCNKLADMDCTCGASNSKTNNRPASRTYRFWGGLTVSIKGDVRANHRPGCIFFQKSRRKFSRTSVTYFGLLSLISQSFTVSLTQEYPTGPYSLSFGLQPCNIVESSPALGLFATRLDGLFEISNTDIARLSPDNIAEYFIKRLRVIYRSGNASPFDVDQDGNNIAHLCLQAFLHHFQLQDELKSNGVAADAICKMFTYLADIGVPITASNFRQGNVLRLSIYASEDLWIIPSLFKLIMSRDPNFYHAEVAYAKPMVLSQFIKGGENGVRQLDALCQNPDICEDIGFSELFLAVITKDHPRLQAILSAEDSLLDISQTDIYRRNIIDASCNWPDGLRLLLQRQEARRLLKISEDSFSLLSTLGYALFYSKIYCNAPDQWTECDDCTCYVALQLLLEADFKVTIGLELLESLAGCSLKARKLFFKHLRDRRQRLRNLSLSILPERVLRQYGVSASLLPDKTAALLWSELQQAQDPQDCQVDLLDSLNPCNDSFFEPQSLFQFLCHPQVVELALDYGFVPRDEIGVETLLSSRYIIPSIFCEDLKISMKYLFWLLQQNLNPEISLGPFRLSILHRIAVFIGNLIYWNVYEASNLLQDSGTWLPALFDNKARCNIPCPCSSGLFTRPLAYILPAMLLYPGDRLLTHFFSSIGECIELVVSCIDLLKLSECSSEYLYMAKCAIHTLTMISLRVRHLPICLTENCYDLKNLLGSDEEEWDEILDEDRELINQLEALDEEFREVFDRQDVSIAEFLRGYWLTRIKEVVQELHKPLTPHDRYELLEAGVVLEEDNADGLECCEDMICSR